MVVVDPFPSPESLLAPASPLVLLGSEPDPARAVACVVVVVPWLASSEVVEVSADVVAFEPPAEEPSNPEAGPSSAEKTLGLGTTKVAGGRRSPLAVLEVAPA